MPTASSTIQFEPLAFIAGHLVRHDCRDAKTCNSTSRVKQQNKRAVGHVSDAGLMESLLVSNVHKRSRKLAASWSGPIAYRT
jgi:hypothetical protein